MLDTVSEANAHRLYQAIHFSVEKKETFWEALTSLKTFYKSCQC